MILAGLFAGVLFIGLILGDWFYFIQLTPDAIHPVWVQCGENSRPVDSTHPGNPA
ncbi:MAG: hypothetical protein HP491_07310 [Nitrospira sp.]|nr:hypothetical protein [Nitrospira sp.]